MDEQRALDVCCGDGMTRKVSNQVSGNRTPYSCIRFCVSLELSTQQWRREGRKFLNNWIWRNPVWMIQFSVQLTWTAKWLSRKLVDVGLASVDVNSIERTWTVNLCLKTFTLRLWGFQYFPSSMQFVVGKPSRFFCFWRCSNVLGVGWLLSIWCTQKRVPVDLHVARWLVQSNC